MKAAFIQKLGKTTETLQIGELPIPEVKEDEILVKVHSAALNPVDWKLMEGYFPSKINFPYIPSEDFSGVVSKVGSSVTRFKEGDEVFGKNYVSSGGAIAQYVAVKEILVAIKPKNISFDEVASIPLAGLTAYQGFTLHSQVKPGNKVLVLGGSGGVGTLAVQFAKHFGAFVATTTSSKNAELMKSLGADLIIDYTKENWGEVLKGQDYDVVLEAANGENNWENAQLVLKEGGVFATIVQYKAPSESTKGIKFSFFLTKERAEDLEEIRRIIESGKLKALIAQTFPLEKVVDAFELSKSSRAVGKIVIKMV